MTLGYGGITTTTTTGLTVTLSTGGGSRTLTRQTVSVTDAATQPTIYTQQKEWMPPVEGLASQVAPNPHDTTTVVSSGITPTASNTSLIDLIKISTPPVVASFAPGYNWWDFSAYVEDQHILECPNVAGSRLGYGWTGNPLLLDCGGNISGVPSWALWKDARRIWLRHTGRGILFSGDAPTDTRAVPFPHHNPPLAPTRPPARGPTRSEPYFQGQSGMLCPDTGKFFALPLAGNDGSPIVAATWWGIPPIYIQEWGIFYGTTAPTYSWSLKSITAQGTVSTIDSGTVAMTQDAYFDPGNADILCHIDATVQSTVTLPTDCVYTYYTISRGGSRNDAYPYAATVVIPAVPSHHRGLVQCPETGCPLDLGYMLQVN